MCLKSIEKHKKQNQGILVDCNISGKLFQEYFESLCHTRHYFETKLHPPIFIFMSEFNSVEIPMRAHLNSRYLSIRCIYATLII